MTDEQRWCDMASFEYSLQHAAGVSVNLLERLCDPDGKGSDGRPVHWKNIAHFQSYNDGERVLARLARVTELAEEES